MSIPNPTRLDPRTRFRPASARNASSSPSRSPSRQAQFVAQEIDPLLDNLSPLSTLKALNLTDALGKRPPAHADLLTRSIGEATTTERAQGIRAAVAAQKLREWHGEVLAWKWPAKKDKILGKGFEPRLPTARQNGTTKEQKEYLGCLPKTVVIQHEERIEEIKDGLEALHVEELKEHVLQAHSSTDNGRKVNGVVQLSDFTAVVTHTILQALPYLSKLTALLNDWDVRIMVLKQVPSLLRQLEKTEAIVDFASDNARSRRTSCLLTRQTFKETRAALEHDVSIIGTIFDELLDLLEGRDDALPDAWIDRMDKLEARWASWTVEAERKVLFNEWLKESGSFIVNHSKMQQAQGPNTPVDQGTVHTSTNPMFPEPENGLDGITTEQDRPQEEETEQTGLQTLARAGSGPFKVSSELSPSTADTSVTLPILHGKISQSIVGPGEPARRPMSSPEARQLSRGHIAEKDHIRGINTSLDPETSAVTAGLPLEDQRTAHVQHVRGASLPIQQPREVSALVGSEDMHQAGPHDQSKSFSAEDRGTFDVMQPSESLSRVRDAENAENAENSCANPVESGSETLHTADISLAAQDSSDPPSTPNTPTSKQPLSLRLPRPVHNRTTSDMSIPRSIASEAFSDLSRAEIGSATTAEALGSPKVIRHSVKLSQEGVANSMAAETLSRTASIQSPRHEMQQHIQSRDPDQELTSDAADQGASTEPLPRKSTDIVTNSDPAGADLFRADSVVAPDSVSRTPSDHSDQVIPEQATYDVAKSRGGSTSSAPVSPLTPVDPSNPFPISDTPRSVSSLASGPLASPGKADLSQHLSHIIREDRLSPPHDAGRLYLAGSDDEQNVVPIVPRRSSKRLPLIPVATPPSKIPQSRIHPPKTPSSVTKNLVQPSSTQHTQDGSAQSHRRQRSSSHHIASQALSSGAKGKQTRDLLQTRIQTLVTDMSDRIRLLSASEAGSPRATPSLASRSTSPWPPLILSPVKNKRQTAPIYSSAPNSEVRMFHLTRSSDPPGTPPIKLFVRLVGPNGERVMVRVGGGWADLGDYLQNYSLHRSARARDGDEQYELASIPVSGQKERTDRRVLQFGTRPESRTEVTPSPLPTVNAVLPSQKPSSTRPSSGLSRRSSSTSLREAFKSVKRRLSISSLRSDRSRGTSPAPSVTDDVQDDNDNWGWNTPTTKFRPQIRTFNPYHDNANWDGKPQRVIIASSSQTSLNTAPPSSSSSSYMQPYQYQSGRASPALSSSSLQPYQYQHQPQYQPQPHLRRGHTSPIPTPKVSNYPPAYRHQQSYPSPNHLAADAYATSDPSNFPVRKNTVMHGYRPYTADADHAPAPNIGPTMNPKLTRKPSLILRGRPRTSGESAPSGIRRVFFRRKAD